MNITETEVPSEPNSAEIILGAEEYGDGAAVAAVGLEDAMTGCLVGCEDEGLLVGLPQGCCDGTDDGESVGGLEGFAEGRMDGGAVGDDVG